MILTIYLKPIFGRRMRRRWRSVWELTEQGWENIQDAMELHKINAFEHLVQRLDLKAVEAVVEESEEEQKLRKQEARSKKWGSRRRPDGGR